MASYLVYISPSRGHLYPLVPTFCELQGRGHRIALKTLSSEVAPMSQLGFDADAIDPRAEAIETDDWRACTPIGAQRREVAALLDRAARSTRRSSA